MTLPYPDSPDIDENIATSIEKIKGNFDYLDTLIGSGNIKCVMSSNANMTTKTGVQVITGVGFEPKAMAVFATYYGSYMNSQGFAAIVSSSIDGACVGQNNSYAGVFSNIWVAQLYDTSGQYIAASVGSFNSDGASITWNNSGSTAGTVANIMYIFFG